MALMKQSENMFLSSCWDGRMDRKSEVQALPASSSGDHKLFRVFASDLLTMVTNAATVPYAYRKKNQWLINCSTREIVPNVWSSSISIGLPSVHVIMHEILQSTSVYMHGECQLSVRVHCTIGKQIERDEPPLIYGVLQWISWLMTHGHLLCWLCQLVQNQQSCIGSISRKENLTWNTRWGILMRSKWCWEVGLHRGHPCHLLLSVEQSIWCQNNDAISARCLFTCCVNYEALRHLHSNARYEWWKQVSHLKRRWTWAPTDSE